MMKDYILIFFGALIVSEILWYATKLMFQFDLSNPFKKSFFKGLLRGVYAVVGIVLAYYVVT